MFASLYNFLKQIKTLFERKTKFRFPNDGMIRILTPASSPAVYKLTYLLRDQSQARVFSFSNNLPINLDMARALNKLRDGKAQLKLHIDLEPQPSFDTFNRTF